MTTFLNYLILRKNNAQNIISLSKNIMSQFFRKIDLRHFHINFDLFPFKKKNILLTILREIRIERISKMVQFELHF